MSSNKQTIIAIDAMGGDIGPSAVIPGAIEAARQTGAKVLLVGIQEVVEAKLSKLALDGVDYEIVHASEVASMDEKPSEILRRKKDASIQVACRLVRDGKADGVLSAGHSGACVACGMFIIGRIPHVDRPAFASVLPTAKKPVVLLDVGSTVDCKPYNIFQFGLMGSAFAADILDRENPTVGLVSIGEEEGKGNSQVKEAYELLKMAKHINFVGNIEGRDIFTGDVDVAVCDGFVGNIALKLTEGLATTFGRLLKRELLHSGMMTKLGLLLARPGLKRFAQVVDYAEYGGAPLLGLKGISFVCHGRSNAKAICSATKMAVRYVEKRTNEHLVANISANEELAIYKISC